MKNNNFFLVLIWTGILLFWCYILYFGFLAYQSGEGLPLFLFILVIPLVFAMISYQRRKLNRLFQLPTPDALITHYHKIMKRSPKGEFLAAHSSAYTAILYGNFDRARLELASLNWDRQLPLYQGLEIQIRVLLAIFEERDFDKAQEFAEEVFSLCNVSSIFPGSNRSRVALQAQVAICKVLKGDHSKILIDQIQLAAKNVNFFGNVIPAWALIKHYRFAGENDKAAHYESLIRKLFPHFPFLDQNLSK